MKKQEKCCRFKSTDLFMIVAVILAAIIGPQFFNGYIYRIINTSLIYVLCVYGASIVTGMLGQMSFAYISFMAFGAYYAANLSIGRLGAQANSLFILLTVSIVVAALGFVIAIILFRLKDRFFVFGTMAFVQIAVVFFGNYEPLFGGPYGINSIPTMQFGDFKFDSNQKWFFFLLGVVLICYFLVDRIKVTKLGRALSAIRDSEMAASCLGINVHMTKVIAFTVSAAFCGMSGALYAMQSGFICVDLFTYDFGTRIVVMLVLGGMSHSVGPIVGALLVTSMPELFRGFQSYLMFAFGVTIIIVMNVMPFGIAGYTSELIEKLKQRFLKNRIEEQRHGINNPVN